MDLRKQDIRSLQQKLIEKGLLNENVSGNTTDGTITAATQLIVENAGLLDQDFSQLPTKRRLTVALQICCFEHSFDPGPLDGYFGPRTKHAATQLYRQLYDIDVVDYEDLTPTDINPNGFPKETTADLNDYYGRLAGQCKKGEVELTRVESPWRMPLDWDMTKARTSFLVNARVAESLERIVNKVYDHYGLQEIERLGLHRFSGDYNPRKITGGSRCSTHAWGISVDFYGSRNELRRSTADSPPPTLAHPDLNFWWECWEEEGWYSLGRMEDRDWMHVQAAKGKRSKYYHMD